MCGVNWKMKISKLLGNGAVVFIGTDYPITFKAKAFCNIAFVEVSKNREKRGNFKSWKVKEKLNAVLKTEEKVNIF